MQISSKVLLSVIALSGVMNGASAALLDRGNGLIYDQDLNVTWLKNANVWQNVRGGLVTWTTANDWAAQLEYADNLRSTVWTDWQLPTSEQLRHLYYSELGGQAGIDLRYTHNSNYALFDNIQPGAYWSNTPWSVSYTHLDVYKRQSLPSADSIMENPARLKRSRYTSRVD